MSVQSAACSSEPWRSRAAAAAAPLLDHKAAPVSDERYGTTFARKLFSKQPQIVDWMQTKLAPEDLAAKVDALFGDLLIQQLFKNLDGNPLGHAVARRLLESRGFTFLQLESQYSKPIVCTHKKKLPGYVIKIDGIDEGFKDEVKFSYQRLIERVWNRDRIVQMCAAHGWQDEVICPEKWIYAAPREPSNKQLALMVIAQEMDISEPTVITERQKVIGKFLTQDDNPANVIAQGPRIVLVDTELWRPSDMKTFEANPLAPYVLGSSGAVPSLPPAPLPSAATVQRPPAACAVMGLRPWRNRAIIVAVGAVVCGYAWPYLQSLWS